MLLNPKPVGQSANAAIDRRSIRMRNIPVATTTPFSSWDLSPKISESQSGRATIRPRNENTRKHQQKLHSSSAVA